MQLEDVLENLVRPKIFLSAAKISLKTYAREKSLKKLIGTTKRLQPIQAVPVLLAYETELEEARKAKSAAYDLKLHIQIMTALLQELSLLPKKLPKA